jgi:hypothetical protein
MGFLNDIDFINSKMYYIRISPSGWFLIREEYLLWTKSLIL